MSVTKSTYKHVGVIALNNKPEELSRVATLCCESGGLFGSELNPKLTQVLELQHDKPFMSERLT